MEGIETVKDFFEKNQLDEASEVLSKLFEQNPSDEDINLWIGKIHFKKGEWGLAINAFQKVLEINPENQEAQSGAEMASDILDYFTPDMFNP